MRTGSTTVAVMALCGLLTAGCDNGPPRRPTLSEMRDIRVCGDLASKLPPPEHDGDPVDTMQKLKDAASACKAAVSVGTTCELYVTARSQYTDALKDVLDDPKPAILARANMDYRYMLRSACEDVR